MGFFLNPTSIFLWNRSHHPFYIGALEPSSSKAPKPASTAGPAPSSPPISSKPLRSSRLSSGPNVRVQPTRSKKKSVVVVSEDESNTSSVEVISAPSPEPIGLCAPPNPVKEAYRANSHRTRAHEEGSSKASGKARAPSLDAITAEILSMLPSPRELVRFYLLLLVPFSCLIFILFL